MYQQPRSSTNKPDYFDQLNEKQQKNWMKTTLKMEKNEKLKLTYPPFQTTSNIQLIHLHYLTSIETIDELIVKAKTTIKYSIDTESAKNKPEGALVQIQMIHSNINSTIVLMEVNYLPDQNTLLYERIKQFCSIIFNVNNEIITWGLFSDELKNFKHLNLFNLGKVNLKTNLQFEFRNYHNLKNTHPARASREVTGASYDTPGEFKYINYENEITYSDCGHHTHYDPNGKCTVNYWQCGLDLKLGTWKQKLFSRRHYDPQIEKAERLNMIQYAQDDCTTVTELYFKMYPNGKNNFIYETPPTTNTINIETPISITIINDERKFNDDFSDISDDELPSICIPQFNKRKQAQSLESNYEQDTVTIQVSTEEINELGVNEEQLEQQRKKEKQRRKNEKYKWKKQHQLNFQNKMRRPIYFKYDYRKIRAQLMSDRIYHTHQITIAFVNSINDFV